MKIVTSYSRLAMMALVTLQMQMIRMLQVAVKAQEVSVAVLGQKAVAMSIIST